MNRLKALIARVSLVARPVDEKVVKEMMQLLIDWMKSEKICKETTDEWDAGTWDAGTLPGA